MDCLGCPLFGPALSRCKRCRTGHRPGIDRFIGDQIAMRNAAMCVAMCKYLFGTKISLSTSVSVPPLFILTDTIFDAFHWLLQKTMFYCGSLGVICNVQDRPKIIGSSKLKINMANAV